MIKIRPQIYPLHDGSLRRSYGLFVGDVFIAYSWTWLGAHRAKWEIERNLSWPL